jgi:DNA-binding transcriptional LysR family regulator
MLRSELKGTSDMHADRIRRLARQTKPALDLEFRQFRAFVALVEQGSVTAASQALSLAQSTVSEAIVALERRIGAALIRHQRGTHARILTPAGEALLPHARNVLNAVDEACVAVAEATVKARGGVGVVANESVSTYVLSPVLTDLRRRWPNTRFSVSVATCPEVRQGVQDGTFDVGLLLEFADRKSSRKVSARRLTRSGDRRTVASLVPLVIFASPEHPLVNGCSRKLVPRSTLAPFSLLVSDAAGDFQELIQHFFREDHLPGPQLESTGSVEGVKRGVAANPFALGVLPSYAIAEELRLGQVVQLDLRPVPPEMRLVALLSRSRLQHPSTSEMLDKMSRAFAAPQLPPNIPA